MWYCRWRVASRADEPNRVAALERHVVGQAGGVALEMPVHEHESIARVGRIYHQPAGIARVQSAYFAASRREDGRTTRSRNVERVMAAAGAPRLVERVEEVPGLYAGDRHDQRAGELGELVAGWLDGVGVVGRGRGVERVRRELARSRRGFFRERARGAAVGRLDLDVTGAGPDDDE